MSDDLHFSLDKTNEQLGEIKKSIEDHSRSRQSEAAAQEDSYVGIQAEIASIAASVRPDNEEKQHVHTLRNKSYRQQWLLNVLTALLFLATLGAFIAAGIYAHIASSQLDQMKIATEQATRSADLAACALKENQRQFQDTLREMKAQTKTQDKAATAARDSVKAIQEQMRIDQRPWVGITNLETIGGGLSPDGASYSFGNIRFKLHNTGRTPALSLQIHSAVFMESVEEDGVGDWAEGKIQAETENFEKGGGFRTLFWNPLIAGGVLVPDGSSSVGVGGGSGFLLRDDGHKRSFRNYREAVYVVGKVTYGDALDKDRVYTTKFCLVAYQRPSPDGFTFCDTGNSMN